MANAKKCDRCGIFYNNSEIAEDIEIRTIDTGVRWVNIKSDTHGNLDLCPKCRDTFVSWWNGGKQ